MTRGLRIAGLDGGLGTFGLSIVETWGDRRACVHADTFESAPMHKRLKIDLAEDRRRRTRELGRWLRTKLDRFRPDIIASEECSYPRNHHAVVAISLAWGVVTTVLDVYGLPLVTAYPKEWRELFVKSGREAAAQNAAIRLVAGFRIAEQNIPKRARVHARDALGVAVWAESQPSVKAAIEAREALVARAA